MSTSAPAPATVDDYLLSVAPVVRERLQQIRQTIRAAAPDAREVISYRMPAFRTTEVLVYFAAFRQHIGLYPPVRGDAELEQAVAPWAGPKGNLQFPLDQPVPLALIARITAHRLQQARARRST